MKKSLIISVLIFLGIGVVLETTAYFTLPYKKADYALELRNPYFRRGWPEYTEALRRDTAPQKLVFVTNSQGFGPEFEAEYCFTNQLQQMFDKQQLDNVSIRNWGAPGAISHDLLILSAKAIAYKADYVFVITYSQNFRELYQLKPVSYSALDVGHILAERPVRKIIGEMFLERFDDQGLFLTTLLRYTSLMRLGEYADDWSNDGKETFWWGYRARAGEQRRKLTLAEDPLSKKPIFYPVDISYFDHFDAMLAANTHTKVVFVLMPLARRALSGTAIRITEQFNQDLIERYTDKGVDVWDMTWALEDGQFYSHTHFSPPLHRIFAEQLFDRIEPLM